MPFLVLFELFIVLELVHAHVGRLDRVDWEKVQDVIIVLFNCHGEALLEHEVESVRLLDELYAAVGSILLHPLDQHRRLFGLFFEFVFGFLIINIVFELLLRALIRRLFRLLLSAFPSFDICRGNRLEYGNIERRLALLVQHEEVMR